MDWSKRIGRRIRVQDLHILSAVVEFRSLARAAEYLAISRPVVSRAIADLETEVGVRLLDRDRHGAVPTIYGSTLLKRGAVVFDELRQSLNDIESLSDPKAGAVRIGCHNFLATGFVTAVIDRLSRSHPRMRFHLMPAETAGMQRDLHARNTDVLVAWRLGGLVTDDGLNFEHLYDDTCVVAAGAQHPLAQRRTVTLADLANERWALPPVDSILGAIEVPAFQAMKLEYPRATVISVAAQALISQLLTGRFLTIVPASMLRFPIRDRRINILPVELRMPRVPIGVVTLKSRMVGPATKVFMDTARQLALVAEAKRQV